MARSADLPDFERGAAPDEARHETAEASAHLSESAHLLGTDDSGLASFFASFTRYATPEDLLRYTGAELAALVRTVYLHTATRKAGDALIVTLDVAAEDARFARRETLLVAVNADAPFLYDSCTAEVRAHGLHIAAAFHPVMNAARDAQGRRAASGTSAAESVIVLALETGPADPRLDALKSGLAEVFADVRAAVADWKPMLARLQETIAALKQRPPKLASGELDETIAFLEWLASDHFTFLGCRDYAFHSNGDAGLEARYETGLGLLANPEARIVRRGAQSISLTPELRDFLTQPVPLIITKSNLRSKVHRRVHMDYIGVKTFDTQGRLTGERRFVGLFTSSAYSQLPSAIPLLRHKIGQVLKGSGLAPSSHDGKALAHILDSYPRDELFQIAEDELLATALGILNLGERPKVRIFLRFDKFDRFVSALVYVPRERYSGQVRARIHALLASRFNGRVSAATEMLEDEGLARIHYIIGRNAGPRPDVDVKELEAEIRTAIRTWEDGFADALRMARGDAGLARLAEELRTFAPVYRDAFSPAEAVGDLERIETVRAGKGPGGTLLAHVYSREDDAPGTVRLKLFAQDDYVPLSDCLPVFENLGLKVIAEEAFLLAPDGTQDGRRIALQNVLMRVDGKPIALETLAPLIEDAFHAVWRGFAESDGFNRLITTAELAWRDIVILRGAAKFLRQTSFGLSQPLMEAALAKNPDLAILLVELFRTLHDPEPAAPEHRGAEAAKLRERIEEALADVAAADDDRIIRALEAVIGAMLRTNFFQMQENGAARPTFAFKLESAKLDMLPAPKPLYEIFVYAPDVEGVHLRFGKIARGGIRWSDRAEDFRTEILGLVKAQQVKNAVIVPVGAKGGFYSKRIAADATREAVHEKGVAAYKTFIAALLDLTDTLDAGGAVQHPADTVLYDGDDPYLVVAADKGTASFSDIANTIAIERGFWLGDAFASGGSHGYDHKVMGITARGAWEAIKRHFRELGRDIQTEPFSCIGVGDMSGDVFGNGMLLSKATRLIAAFDHRHIFFDPTPDAERSWTERKRLFDLPRSSWGDYDASLISKGGGIYPRSAKDIVLSPEMKAVTGLSRERATPGELIRAFLKAECDLLFFGGIGTFIKATSESQAQAGDRANDALRVDGREVRARVVGEGANLGVTQLGRIEYARRGGPEKTGGRIESDAIDNSAGVDTSDHEVNIKILMSGPLRRGEISDNERDVLLAAMTEDIARLVLKDNYDQTFALSVAELTAAKDLDASARFMRELERTGRLDRAVEKLPTDEVLTERAHEGAGLTRPEIAVLLAYAKLDLARALAESTLPDEPYFDGLLRGYFPPAAAARFAAEIPRHRLARDIVTTELVNRLVNLAGPLFVHRMRELSSAPAHAVARAYALADGAFGLEALAQRIGALDGTVPAAAQNAMMGEIARLLRRLGLWFVVHLPADMALAGEVQTYRDGYAALKTSFADVLSPFEAQARDTRLADWKAAGVPDDMAADIAALPLLNAAPEIILLAGTNHANIAAAARAYFSAGASIGLERLRQQAGDVVASDHWERLALRRIVDDLYSAQRLLAAGALALEGKPAEDGVAAWKERHGADIARVTSFLAELDRGGTPSLAKLVLASSQIQKIAGSTP